jgi:hypothetical protein
MMESSSRICSRKSCRRRQQVYLNAKHKFKAAIQCHVKPDVVLTLLLVVMGNKVDSLSRDAPEVLHRTMEKYMSNM